MKNKFLLFSLLIGGCLNEANPSQDLSSNISDMTQINDSFTKFDCEERRIDKDEKEYWDGLIYYWDCKLDTYCSLRLYGDTTYCVPIVQANRNESYFLDKECKVPSSFLDIVIVDANESKIPLNTRYLDFQGGSHWEKVAPIDISKITLYILDGKCTPILAGADAKFIGYINDPFETKHYLLEDFAELAH